MRVECAIQTQLHSKRFHSKQEDANFYVCATELLWMPSLEDYFAIYFLEGDIQHLSFSLEFMIKSLSSLMKQTSKQTVNQLYQESKDQDAQRTNNSLQ